ncbi:MAG: hypothetical protein RL148_2628 [Planctomycetota bacterium]
MQDRYAFDQGDYSKVGLVRHLGRDARRRIGLLWYANRPTRTEATNGDGRHFTYLTRSDDLAACDRELHAAWARAWGRVPRSIASLEAHTPWPRGMRFFSEPVPTRYTERDTWFGRALRALDGCQLVFCDPDNGIARPGTAAAAGPSPKHALLHELDALLGTGASVVAYHHCDRSAPHAEQAMQWRALCRARWPGLADAVPVRYRRGSGRLYLVLVQTRHEQWLRDGLAALHAGPWVRGGHFTLDTAGEQPTASVSGPRLRTAPRARPVR